MIIRNAPLIGAFLSSKDLLEEGVFGRNVFAVDEVIDGKAVPLP